MKIELDQIIHARKQLHQAVQLVSAFPRSYLNIDDNDKTASLSWDSTHRALVSEKVMLDGIAYRSGLCIAHFSLAIFKDDKKLFELSFEGKSFLEVRNELTEIIGKCGLASDKLNFKMPYVIPIYETNSVKSFDVLSLEYLHEIELLYDDANRIFHNLFDYNDKVSEFRCWPQDFKFGALLSNETDGKGGLKKNIGIGISPGDELISQPYYYVQSWSYPLKETILDMLLLGKGTWHYEGWIGSKLLYEEFIGSDALENQVASYLNSSIRILSVYSNS